MESNQESEKVESVQKSEEADKSEPKKKDSGDEASNEAAEEEAEAEQSELVDEEPPKTANLLIKDGTSLVDFTIMHLNDKDMRDTCGYCDSKKPDPGSAQWGIVSPRISVDDYQHMMDRGWRRCGTYIYKYDLE